MIADIRANRACDKVKIIVGGRPFQTAPDLWKDLRADGFAFDAQSAVSVAQQLTSNRGDI
jgi:methanogenic corrinoid protein MtbC1